MKQRSIHALIYRNYLKSSLIPILVIEVALLLLYFGINFYISEKNRSTLLSEATKNIEEISSREVAGINRQLVEVTDLARIMLRDHEAFFAHDNGCYLPNGEPEFGVHKNGAFHKISDNGGSSLYYAKSTPIGAAELRKARCSEMLDPLLISIVETSSLVTQAYLNTWDDMNRLYPFMTDAPAQYGPAINMEDYNFYYDADAKHNPERKAVWTGAYLDPAGQGWMVSVIVPIYRGDFLEGVSGLDVTINSFVQHVLNLEFPWGAGTFMVDKSGTILAMQDTIEKIFKIQELKEHQYSENILETIEKPKEFNLLTSTDTAIRKQFNELFTSRKKISSMTIDGVDYLVSQEIVAETGWRMITLIEKEKVFAPITQLKELSYRAGFIAIAAMLVFYAVFFGFLLTKSKKLTTVIAAPITRLSELTKDLGKHLRAGEIALSGIDEVDNLVVNFDTMSRELEAAIAQANAARREADSVITNFLDSLLVVDPQLRIARVNKETCQLLGCKESELLGRPVSDLFEEPDAEIAACFNFPFLPETRDLPELRNVELTFMATSGKRLPVSVNLARLNNDDEETIGVVAGAKDIGELKEALLQAEQQRLFIQNILNTVPGGLLVISENAVLSQANETFHRQIQTWCLKYGFTDQNLRTQIISAIAERIQRQQSGEIVFAGYHDELIIEYHASTNEMHNGKDNRVIFLHDVTARHRAEAVRKLQATVLEQTSEGVIITDTDGVIQNVNLAAEQMSGYAGNDLVGRKTSVFKSGIHDDNHYRSLWETLLLGEVWTGSMTNRHQNGSLFETEMTVSPVRSSGGGITHYVSLWRDVSQERTLQRQLLQAQKLEAIGQLAAGVAHEINTPLQYIQNNLAFLKTAFSDITPLLDELQAGIRTPELFTDSKWQQNLSTMIENCDLEFLSEEIVQGVTDALNGVEHVTRIVMAMKEFSHPGGEKKTQTDLNRLVDNAVIVTQNEWKRVADLKTSFDPRLPAVLCDSSAIRQVLLNLIINAADAIKEKFAEEKDGEISITTRAHETDIELIISDNGSGIKKEIRDRIFEPFFTTKAVGKGSGQGLAIVYDIIVNKHNGSIRVDSEEEIGTSMIISLPI